MATELGRVKSTAANKYDTFVASQLKQAETRIRMLDLTAGLFGLAALSLAYIVGMVLCDNKFLLSQHTRQLSLYLFLVGAAVYLFLAVLRPLRLRVNPYYAARQVEQQLPQAKNSIVNWVDLHEQPLPLAIRGALGQRAAKDLSRIDLDSTISGRRAYWMGGLAGLFAVAFVVSYLLLGPAPFLSLLKRTFNPFAEVGVSTRTRLTLLKPEGGNTTVTVGRGVNFAVDVGGKIPDPKAANAVKLLYRYDEGEPWLERRLIQERSGEWTSSLSAIEVKNGFWYKITGGDAATEEYQVSVRAAAAITDFLAVYHFRSYVARTDEVHRERGLKALRGTEVLLHIRTNRTLREGRLEFESNGRAGSVNPLVTFVRAEVDAKDPNAFLVRFVLNEDGNYRLSFTSTDGEAYRDPVSYAVTAIPDHPPMVELTKPGKDIPLPADALLHLEGKAGDDIGIRNLILRMRVIGGGKLRGQPYRSDEQLRLTDGGYTRELDYQDFVDLSRVQSDDGQPFRLRGGMELEYWLEASDACDYPQPNVTESKHYRVLIEPGKNDPKKTQEKKQAERGKQQHEQKQDQKRQKENQERQQQRQQQQALNKEQESKNAEKSGAGEKSQSQESGQENNSGGQEKGEENKGQQGGSKAGSGEANKSDQNSELSKEDQKVEDRIKNALEKKQGGENGKGESKSEKGNQGDSKSAEQNKQDGDAGSGNKSKGENKNSGTENDKQSGEGKDNSQPQAGSNPLQGDGKSEKNGKEGESKKPNGKDGGSKNKTAPAEKAGQEKAGTDSQSSKNANQGEKKPENQGQGSSKEESNSATEKSQQPKGADGRKGEEKTERNQGGSASENKPSAQGETKPNPAKDTGEKNEKAENKQESSASARDATTKDISDLARALQSKDADKREKAKQQLQRIEKEAADPAAREKAAQALEKAGKQDNPTGKNSPKNAGDPAGKPSEERKEGEKENGPKSTDPSKDASGGKNANLGEKSDQNGKKRPGSSPYEGKQGSPTSQDGTPGGGGDRRNGKGESGTPPSQPKEQEKPRDHRAAQLQLEDFAKRVNKDILKEAGVSEEAWKKYLDAKRKQLTPREKPRPEAPIAPQQANQLPSMGGRTIQPDASGQGETQSPTRGQPLPGYRDSFRKFTQEMSKKN